MTILAGIGTLSVDGPAVQVNISKPGADAYITFTGAAGQRIHLDFTEVTLPNQCGGYSLRAPDGSAITGFCVINGRGTFDEDGIVLSESGTFTIELNPGDRKTGIGTLRVRS